MSETNPTDFSLKDQIKKRRTQEILRAVESKPLPSQLQVPLEENLQPVAQKTSSSAVTSTARPAVARSSSYSAVAHPIQHSRQFRLLLLLGGLVICLVVFVGLLIASLGAAPIAPTAEAISLPIISKTSLVDALKQDNVAVVGERPRPTKNGKWTADEAVELFIQQGDVQTSVIVLTYQDAKQKVPDTFKLASDVQFKDWQQITFSNLLIVASPKTSTALLDQLNQTVQTLLVEAPTLTP